jgi:UDP-N-acetylmuramoyl-tripeptide--D-alanyl-D-alanine ligase
MSCCIALGDLIEVVSASPANLSAADYTAMATGITTDSRNLQAGEVFVALRGDRFDGHTFVAQAIQQGAIAAIVDRPETVPSDLPLLLVEDTLKAYQAIAHWWRHQFSIPVIAVTGSVGKTTTKELIAAVLQTKGRVLKSQANYNNEIGVPKTLLELNSTHDYAVIEMGMRGRGEIALLAQIADPDIAVITNVGTAHIGRLGSEQAIAEAKCELLAELKPTGTAILNHDNARLIETAKQLWQGQTLTYGIEGGDISGKLLDSTTLLVGELSLPLPLAGAHNALNYLAALAVATGLKIDWSPLAQGLSISLPQGRAQRHDLPNDIVILDETYNAGLESMLAALQLLAQTPGKRHVAVLGTMKELGARSLDFHQQVGNAVRDLNLDQLFILADEAESRAMAAGAAPIPTEQFCDHATLIARLSEVVQPGDRLLFKASRAVGLDKVVEAFCREISRAAFT